jgi:hypothetical protein
MAGSVIPKEAKLETLTRWVSTDVMKVCLLLDTFTFVSGTHILYTDVTANEVAAGTGYTLGGQALTDSATNVGDNAVYDATDSAWPASSFTARYACIYDDTTKKIRAILDFGVNYTVTAGTFTIVWNASGIVKIS